MRLKKITLQDLKFLYELNTDKKVRKFSHTKKRFSFKSHCLWWESKLKEKTFEARLILVKNIPIGCIRRDKKLISIAILPKFWGMGYGRQAILKFCKRGDRAEVNCKNLRSLKMFRNNGFSDRFVTLIMEK